MATIEELFKHFLSKKESMKWKQTWMLKFARVFMKNRPIQVARIAARQKDNFQYNENVKFLEIVVEFRQRQLESRTWRTEVSKIHRRCLFLRCGRSKSRKGNSHEKTLDLEHKERKKEKRRRRRRKVEPRRRLAPSVIKNSFSRLASAMRREFRRGWRRKFVLYRITI